MLGLGITRQLGKYICSTFRILVFHSPVTIYSLSPHTALEYLLCQARFSFYHLSHSLLGVYHFALSRELLSSKLSSSIFSHGWLHPISSKERSFKGFVCQVINTNICYIYFRLSQSEMEKRKKESQTRSQNERLWLEGNAGTGEINILVLCGPAIRDCCPNYLCEAHITEMSGIIGTRECHKWTQIGPSMARP